MKSVILFASHILTNSVMFISIMVGSVGISHLLKWIETMAPPPIIVFGLHGCEHMMFAGDILIFIYMLNRSYKKLKSEI